MAGRRLWGAPCGPDDLRSRQKGRRTFFRLVDPQRSYANDWKARSAQDQWKPCSRRPRAPVRSSRRPEGRTFRERWRSPRPTPKSLSSTAKANSRRVTAAKPSVTTPLPLPEELKQGGLQHLRDAVALLETKATTDKVGDYRRFIVTLAGKVANARREHGRASATPSSRRSTRSPRRWAETAVRSCGR